MKKIIFYVLFATLIVACSDTDRGNGSVQMNLHFRNTGFQDVTIEAYFGNVLKKSEVVGSMQAGTIYSFFSPNEFDNFALYADSLVFKYSNGRGYICSPTSVQCIFGKPTPFSAVESDFIKEGDLYFYELTETDYQNAFEL